MSAVPLWLLIVSCVIPLFALVMSIINLRYYRRTDPRATLPDPVPQVFVCIPARNEQENLPDCLAMLSASDYTNLRVRVYDDQSTDNTTAILRAACERDSRVSSAATRELPPGWVGKQWACEQLGLNSLNEAQADDYLLFIDCDVRLAPSCIRRAVAEAHSLKADLLSTFPRQITASIGEALMIPLIHFILLSYLPFPRMRRSNDPSASAACGQFMLICADAYRKAGGHSLCKDSMHDGVKLPRAFRRAGFRTDLFDGTDIAWCRMYRGFLATWSGFAKNAFEGLGSPILLCFLTALHIVGHVLPWAYLAGVIALGRSTSTPAHDMIACAAVLISVLHRAMLAAKFQQSALSVILHPVGVMLMTAVQWYSFGLQLLGRRTWRGRTGSGSSDSVAAVRANTAN